VKKAYALMLVYTLCLLSTLANAAETQPPSEPAHIEPTPLPSPIVTSSGTSHWVTPPDQHPYSQIFSLQAGSFRPTSISLSNSQQKFDYVGNSLNSYLIEPGWGIKLFHLLGAVYLQQNLFFSSFNATLPGQSDNLNLLMMGLDMRLRHSWEWFPVRAIVPFIEGGYQFTFYTQSGPSDFESANGLVGNMVAGAGFDFWINGIFPSEESVLGGYNSVPIFLTVKVSQIVAGNSPVNLGSTNYLVGLSVGI